MKTCIVCKGFISEPNKSNDLADGLHICDLCNARVDAYKAKVNLYIQQVEMEVARQQVLLQQRPLAE